MLDVEEGGEGSGYRALGSHVGEFVIGDWEDCVFYWEGAWRSGKIRNKKKA